MDWNFIGRLADLLGIGSFLLSCGILRKINSKTASQKEIYNAERAALLRNLQALQENIWNDGLISPKIQDTLQQKVFEYQIKYSLISSPRCHYHSWRCSFLLKKGINDTNTQKIRVHLNYLIARLSKKE